MSRWYDIELASGLWQKGTSFGVYEHVAGRVFLEGTFYNDVSQVGDDVIGTFPASLAPAVDTPVDAYANPQLSDDVHGPAVTLVATTDGTLRFARAGDGFAHIDPIRPEVLEYGVVVHNYWTIGSPADDNPSPDDSVGGIRMVKHGNRVHLRGPARVFDTSLGSWIAVGIAPAYRPSPAYIGLTGTITRQLMVPLAAIPRCLVNVDSSGSMYPDSGWHRSTSHFTYSPAGIGSAADYGGWTGTDFVTGETIHVATEDGTDVSDPEMVTVTHSFLRELSFPDTSIDDPTDSTIPGTMLLMRVNGAENIYYKIMYQQQSGFYWRALYRCDGLGVYTKIGETSHIAVPIVADTINMGALVYDASRWNGGLGRDGHTDGLVFEVNLGPTFFTVFHDPSSTEVDRFTGAGTFPGSQGVLADPGGDWSESGRFRVRLSKQPLDLAQFLPSTGDEGEFDYTMGWHVEAGSIEAGAIKGGVVRARRAL